MHWTADATLCGLMDYLGQYMIFLDTCTLNGITERAQIVVHKYIRNKKFTVIISKCLQLTDQKCY